MSESPSPVVSPARPPPSRKASTGAMVPVRTSGGGTAPGTPIPGTGTGTVPDAAGAAPAHAEAPTTTARTAHPSGRRSFLAWLAAVALWCTFARRQYASARNVHRMIERSRPVNARSLAPPSCIRRQFHVQEKVVDEEWPVWRIERHDIEPIVHIFYLPGGAYVRPMYSWHWRLVEQLVLKQPCAVTVVQYPVAPEVHFQESFMMVKQQYEALVQSVGSGRNVVLMGDSAGGGLALALAQRLVAENNPHRPAAMVLLSPWVDATLTHPAIASYQHNDPVLMVPGLREAAHMWAGFINSMEDPRLSPVRGRLDHLPPTRVYVGTHDLLCPDAREFVSRAQQAQANVEYYEAPKMVHDWMFMSWLPESKVAIQDMVDFIRAHARV